MAEPPGASGNLAAESLSLVRDSGADRLLQPTRYGGREAPVAEFVAAVADLAARDGSAGWLAAAVNAAAYAVAGSGVAAARVWGADAAALVTACGDATGQVNRRRGQVRLTGRWPDVPGAEVADWFLLSAGDDGACRRVLLPRAAVEVDCHRDLRGLDTAGIGDVTVTDTVVDDHDVFDLHDDSPCSATEFPNRQLPSRVVTGAAQAAAVVGAAAGVWQAHVGGVRQRLATSYGSEDTAELTSSAVLVAKAASDIDAARLQLSASVDAGATDAAAAHRQAVTRARAAADQLVSSGSRHALDAADPVARLWLDVLAGYRLALGGIALG